MKPRIERFVPLLVRSFPIFEGFTPFLVSYFLKRTLVAWKKKGLIDNFEARAVRLTKFHYEIELKIFLTKEQTRTAINDLINELTRWIDSQLIQIKQES